ncbi:hypothetical protein G6F50_018596 [Rhizopus delemar]|uniref:Uncharacterized protein n=1 Tax=Rhizopus delemar TaxID=936053 RepID=A0A9P6XM86_9FUNG|nr:hypothetical protein G6F50_018596 [Rhizopus delemar]
MAEVGVVAQQAQRHHATDDHRGQQGAGEPMLETAAELFDGKDDAGQRCVEGGGDTGCATGQQEVRELTRILEAEPAAEQVHQAGAHMHGGAFAPH